MYVSITLTFNWLVLRDVLRYILSDKNRKDVVKQIRDYCDVAVQRIHSDSYYTIEDFIIRKVRKNSIITALHVYQSFFFSSN